MSQAAASTLADLDQHHTRRDSADVAHSRSEFINFAIDDAQYGVDIMAVCEIKEWSNVTHLPKQPEYVRGVLNLRGVIVPVVDLRMKLGCESVAYDASTVVIVLNVRGRVIGTVVDSVSDVLALDAEDIKPAPEMNLAVEGNHILGIGCVSAGDTQRMLILTDIDALMSSAEMGLISAVIH